MSLKDFVESNPVLLALSLLLTGFLGGIAAYDAILRIAHLETIAASDLGERDKTLSQLKQTTNEQAQKIAALEFDNKRLTYQVEEDQRQMSKASLAQLDGEWVNKDPNTNGITHFVIAHHGDDIFIHAWGKCHPTDCDWGEQLAFVGKDLAVVILDQAPFFATMKIRLNKNTELISDYASMRPKYDKVEVFSYKEDRGPSTRTPPTPSAKLPPPAPGAPP
jgi:hypothetical protein